MTTVYDSVDWKDLEIHLVRPTLLQTLYRNPLPTVLLATIITLIITRITSTLQNKSNRTGQDGANVVPAVPYWIPLLGHIPNMTWDADGFAKALRSIYDGGAFALNLGGSKHNVVYTPGLVAALLNQKRDNADAEEVGLRLMQRIFGFPSSEVKQYHAALPDLLDCYREISVAPGLSNMVNQTVRKTRENINNLVTFLDSPVDQMPWEKVAKVEVQGGEEVVEASLLELIRDFCAHTANESIMGSDFLHNTPEFLSDLWTLDRGFLLLATGLPRWAPIPALTRAHISRKKNLERLDIYHENLEKWSKGEDVEPKWSSLDDIGSLVKARLPVYQKHGFSIRARAATEHALMWAANANSNALVFWMINRIYSDRPLLAMLREEVAPYLPMELEKTGLPISEPPRITFIDIEALCSKCSLLKSVYVECLRLDTAPWSFKVVKETFVLQSREKNSEKWLLKQGEYVHA